MATPTVKYSYGDRSSAYSVRRGTAASRGRLLGSIAELSSPSRPAPRTLRGGEFDWGGTSVKR